VRLPAADDDIFCPQFMAVFERHGSLEFQMNGDTIMGNPMTKAVAQALTPVARPTPLLTFLAGEHAPRIAAAWPAPHTAFFALPTARRHAAAILLARPAPASVCHDVGLAHFVAHTRDGEIANTLVGGQAPGGLLKVLGRCGEVLWAADDYVRMLTLFTAPEGCQLLRHLPEVRPLAVAEFERLPPVLRLAAIVRNLPGSAAATTDLVAAWQLAVRIHGDRAGMELLARWTRAATPAQLFDWAAEALDPVRFGDGVPAPVLGDAFEAVTDRKTLDEVALEFRNCLRDFANDLAIGCMRVYVRRPARAQREPSAAYVFALRLDVAGWRLAEARGVDNADVSDADLTALVATLRHAGVRTGEAVSTLRDRLHDHGCTQCGTANAAPRMSLREQLALGSLWS
jgi:hypothetical protein